MKTPLVAMFGPVGRGLCVVAALWVTMAPGPAFAEMDVSTRDALDAFTGKWEGVFRVYTIDGELLHELHIRQHYWWDGDVQVGRFIEVGAGDADQPPVTADARNYVEDGQLLCEVVKSNGEQSVHRGVIDRGLVFWFTKTPGKVESFKEHVVTDDDGARYQIDGFGVYGEGEQAAYLLFEGRYRKVE